MFELIGEVVLDLFLTVVFDPSEKSYASFGVKTFFRLLICGIPGVIGYVFIYHGISEKSTWTALMGSVLLGIGLFFFLRTSLRSFKSLRKMKEEGNLPES